MASGFLLVALNPAIVLLVPGSRLEAFGIQLPAPGSPACSSKLQAYPVHGASRFSAPGSRPGAPGIQFTDSSFQHTARGFAANPAHYPWLPTCGSKLMTYDSDIRYTLPDLLCMAFD